MKCNYCGREETFMSSFREDHELRNICTVCCLKKDKCREAHWMTLRNEHGEYVYPKLQDHSTFDKELARLNEEYRGAGEK